MTTMRWTDARIAMLARVAVRNDEPAVWAFVASLPRSVVEELVRYYPNVFDDSYIAQRQPVE